MILVPQIENKKTKHSKYITITAPFEADAQLGYMSRNGYAELVYSCDSDMICYQCPIVIRKIDTKDFAHVIEYKKVIETLGLTRKQFTDLCVLCGNDYISSVGKDIETLLKLIKEHGDGIKVIRFLNMPNREEYECGFKYIARMMYYRQPIFNFDTNCIGYIDGKEDIVPLLKLYDDDIMIRIVKCEISFCEGNEMMKQRGKKTIYDY